MINEYTQLSNPFKPSSVIKDHYSTSLSKRKKLNGCDNQSYSFQTQFDFLKSAYYPLRKNHLLTNRDFKNKENLFPTCHIGTSTLNHPSIHQKQKGFFLYRIRKAKKIIKQEVNSIIEKLLDTQKGKESQELKAETTIDPTQDNIKKEEEKRLKLINDIHPKEYILEAFTTESDNASAFRSYKLQLNSLGNEYNRRHVLHGVNGYNLNTVKYKTLNNPSRISSKDDSKADSEITFLLNFGKGKKKDLFFGNENLRNKKKVAFNYGERISLPEITYIESIEEKVNENVKIAQNTSDSLKKRSELFRRKQKEYLNSIKK